MLRHRQMNIDRGEIVEGRSNTTSDPYNILNNSAKTTHFGRCNGRRNRFTIDSLRFPAFLHTSILSGK